MNINQFVGSCALGSIERFGDLKGIGEVLKQFCKETLGEKCSYAPNYSKLQCFYVFTAGPEVPSTAPGGSHHSKNHWPKYGTELAAYIVDNKLGEIATLGPKKNEKFHSTSTAQVWIWSPDQKAMESWWDKYQKGQIHVK